jgi:hypothetical protein
MIRCHLLLLILSVVAWTLSADEVKTEPPLNDVRLKEIIDTYKLRSTTAVLAKLYELYGVANFAKTKRDQDASEKLDIFHRVVPVESTGSETHNSDDKHPRLLFVNTDGTFFMALDGDEKSLGHLILQAIQLKEKKDDNGKRRRYWDFQQIDFPKDAQGTVQIYDGNPHHGASPISCATCHRRRPLVEPYAFWPKWFSAYESATPREKKMLDDFMAEQKDHPFYKYAIDHLRDSMGFGASGNIETFNVKASRANFLVIEDELKASPRYQPFKFALLGALLGCPKIDAFIPEVLKSGKRTLKAVQDNTRLINKAHFEANVKASEEGAGPLREKANQDGMTLFQTSSVRWVVEEMLGINMGDWSMTLMKPSYAFADGNKGLFRLALPVNEDVGLPKNQINDAVEALFKHIDEVLEKGKTANDLAELTELDLPANQTICSSLRDKSKAALDEAVKKQTLSRHSIPGQQNHQDPPLQGL